MPTQSNVMNRKNIPHGTENLPVCRLLSCSVLGERRMDNPAPRQNDIGIAQGVVLNKAIANPQPQNPKLSGLITTFLPSTQAAHPTKPAAIGARKLVILAKLFLSIKAGIKAINVIKQRAGMAHTIRVSMASDRPPFSNPIAVIT
jgi:hypothetical protein